MCDEPHTDIGALVKTCGLPTVTKDIDPSVVLEVVRKAREAAKGLAGDEQLVFLKECEKCLREAGYLAAEARALLRPTGQDSQEAPADGDSTFGGAIIDVVVLADGGPAWLLADERGTRIEVEHEGRKPWPQSALPWEPIGDARRVERALSGDPPTAPIGELAQLLRERVILPEPAETWSVLLAAWTIGTYLLNDFSYFPLLLLEGPTERGKTRLGKAVLWPSYRGLFTPSPSEATLRRDRAYHGITMLLDVEDLPGLLKQGGGLGDLILNSWERDGVVRRCIHPDAPPQDQIQTWKAYGATILITNKPVLDSSPLASRSLRVPMPEAGHVSVPQALRPDDVVELKAQILAWVADRRARGVLLPDFKPPFTGRLRDIVAPILRVLQEVDPAAVPDVVALCVEVQADRKRETGRTWEARVAVGLWAARGDVSNDRLYIDDLSRHVNEGLSENDPDRLSNQRIGVARRGLRLKGGRGGTGGRSYLIWPGDEQARALHERYAPLEDPQETSGSSASSGTPEDPSLSGLKTLKTPPYVFSPDPPHEHSVTEDPEDPEDLIEPSTGNGFAGDLFVESDRKSGGSAETVEGEL